MISVYVSLVHQFDIVWLSGPFLTTITIFNGTFVFCWNYQLYFTWKCWKKLWLLVSTDYITKFRHGYYIISSHVLIRNEPSCVWIFFSYFNFFFVFLSLLIIFCGCCCWWWCHDFDLHYSYVFLVSSIDSNLKFQSSQILLINSVIRNNCKYYKEISD